MLTLLAGLFLGMTAQDCATYFPSTKGAEIEMQYFDSKEKLLTISTYTVMNVESLTDGIKIQTHFKVEPQGKGDPYEDDFDFYCQGGKFYFDMKQYLKDMQMDQFEDMEVGIESEDLSFPSQLNTGDMLEDASITITVKSGGMKLMSMVVRITDRKVEGMETVSTPAGTFECHKISYNVESKSMFTITMKEITWYAKGVGAVKTEDYNKKGKLEGYSILTRLKN